MRKLFLFTAALLLLACMAAPPVMAVGTLAGTTISNQAYGDYKDANGNAMSRVYSNTVTVTVSQVAAVSTSPETASHNGLINSEVAYPVTITNEGNGTDTINLAASITGTTGTGTPISTVKIYRDDNGDGIWDAGETTIVTDTGALAADASFKAFAVVTVPSDADNGDTGTATFTATSAFNGSVSDTSTFTTTVQSAVMTLTKAVSPANPKPGDLVTYSITGSNSGTATAYDVLALDSIPANTTYVAGSMKAGPVGGDYAGATGMTDASDSDDAYYDSGNNRVQLDWAECPPSGVFYFQVKVNDNVPQGTVISNSMTATYALSDGGSRDYSETSNSATCTVDYYPGVLLSPNRSGSGNPSDQIVYAFTAQNTGNASDTIDLTYTSASGWTWVIWHDVDGNGIPGTDGDVVLTDTDADGTIDTGVLAQGASIALLAVTSIPVGTSDGSVDSTVITGASSRDTGVTSSVTMTTTVKAPVLSVTKAITDVQAPGGGAHCTPTDPATGAGCTYVPGSVITYQVTATNNGTGNATAVVITDVIPTHTTYVAGSIRTGSSTAGLVPRTDASDGDGGRYEGGAVIVGGSGTLTLGPSGTWVAEFKVMID
ncbi:MAG: DUF11 domain-containing protein [Deltaproteobacteria bacterium]|nr:DUF11 domain-containing protein [Deltaproteobacteria bacterium]